MKMLAKEDSFKIKLILLNEQEVMKEIYELNASSQSQGNIKKWEISLELSVLMQL